MTFSPDFLNEKKITAKLLEATLQLSPESYVSLEEVLVVVQ